METNSRKCVYAGSFDPITIGHFWMIQEASRMFDEVVVAIGVNPQKKPHYPIELRLEMIRASLADLKNVTVTSFSGQFLVEYATTHGADFILRGIRSETDFEYERGMRRINDRINPKISTTFLIPPENLSEISSSMVRGLIGPPGWTHIVKSFLPTPVFETLLRFEMEKKFLRTFSTFAETATTSLAADLFSKYEEPHRSYHNLTHIAECLAELQTLELAPAGHQAIECAIWFHDVIYDPKSKTNEEDSAAYFEKHARELGLAPALVSRVSAFIHATKRHELLDPNDKALALFLDIDLSILGSDEKRFQAYDEAIREEFSWVPSLLYGPKRKKILKAFLDRNTLFLTPEFKERYEARARENLKKVTT